MWHSRPRLCERLLLSLNGGWSAPEGASAFGVCVEMKDSTVPPSFLRRSHRTRLLRDSSRREHMHTLPIDCHPPLLFMAPPVRDHLLLQTALLGCSRTKSTLRASELVFIVSGRIRAAPDR